MSENLTRDKYNQLKNELLLGAGGTIMPDKLSPRKNRLKLNMGYNWV